MFTWDWVAFSSSSVLLDFLGCLSAPDLMMGLTIAGTDVCMAALGELDSEGMELVKVVARVGDFPWFVSQPSDRFQDRLEVSSLLLLWVGVVESRISSITYEIKDIYLRYVRPPWNLA